MLSQRVVNDHPLIEAHDAPTDCHKSVVKAGRVPTAPKPSQSNTQHHTGRAAAEDSNHARSAPKYTCYTYCGATYAPLSGTGHAIIGGTSHLQPTGVSL